MIDHMDPLQLGGEDSLRNVVYCCSRCNSRKKDRLFTKWLSELGEPFQSCARKIYEFKHQHSPEVFQIEQPTIAGEGNFIGLDLDEPAFRREFRGLLPLQDGPPTMYLFDIMKQHPGPVDIESMICSDCSLP